jgi:oligopeptide/dipeptide ABC transporter ATP-binding protein
MLLKVKDLHVAIGKKEKVKILNSVSLELDKKQVIGIIGESGSGKSMTVKSILNLLPKHGEITQGEILYKGTDLVKLSDKEMRKLLGSEIGMIFQNSMTALNPLIKIKDQVAEVIKTHNKNLSEKEIFIRVDRLLKEVNLPNIEVVRDKYPHELSGGQKQRVLIAIAIANAPDMLIADEATTALDVTVQFQIVKLLKSMLDKYDMSMVFISHDLGLIRHVADYVYIMYAGEILEKGDVLQIFKNPKHPYTKGLIRSLPEFSKKGNKIEVIPGRAISVHEKEEGCPFYKRCNIRVDSCKKLIKEVEIEDNHYVKCIKAGDRDE